MAARSPITTFQMNPHFCWCCASWEVCLGGHHKRPPRGPTPGRRAVRRAWPPRSRLRNGPTLGPPPRPPTAPRRRRSTRLGSRRFFRRGLSISCRRPGFPRLGPRPGRPRGWSMWLPPISALRANYRSRFIFPSPCPLCRGSCRSSFRGTLLICAVRASCEHDAGRDESTRTQVCVETTPVVDTHELLMAGRRDDARGHDDLRRT